MWNNKLFYLVLPKSQFIEPGSIVQKVKGNKQKGRICMTLMPDSCNTFIKLKREEAKNKSFQYNVS